MKIKWTPVKRFLPGSSAWYGSVANKPPPAIVDCVFWYFAKKSQYLPNDQGMECFFSFGDFLGVSWLKSFIQNVYGSMTYDL